ncbi:MAG: Dehydrogenase [Acidimicrobiales bacterium]|nr:Dehydrogenase [Acidimicrobiales bacterium]
MSDVNEQVDVVVVGGGLAGLAAAATAAQSGARVVLLDGHPLGGRARSDDRNGFTFNRGPHALYLGGPAEAVLQGLGVAMDGAAPPLRGGLCRHEGRIHALPSGPGSLLRTGLLRVSEKPAFAKVFMQLPKLDPAAWVGRTVAELRDHLGLRGTVAEVLEAIVRLTTYVNAPAEMDAGAAVVNAQGATGAGVRYLHGGFQSLVDGLADAGRARGVDVRTGSAVRAVEPADGSAWRVQTTAGAIDAGTVVVAVGTPDAAAAVLGHRPAAWAGLAPAVTASCLDLGLRRPPERRFILGIDEPLYLSTHDPAARLAPADQSVVHVMRYHPVGDTMPAPEQEALLRGLAADAGITAEDVVEERFLAHMVVAGSFPTAATGGLAGRPTVELAGRPGLLLAGDWVGPVGLLSDAALATGREAGHLAAARAAKISVA